MTAGEGREEIEGALGQAARRLADKGLLTAGDVLSQRIPEQNAFVSVILPSEQQAPLAFVHASLSGARTGLHHRIYAARPDVGAIAAGAFKWTHALARLNISLPAVFDEQVRHLGGAVPRVAMRSTDDKTIPALTTGANAYCLDDTSLCLGMGLERLMPNIEILEKCAESFVLAHCASQQVKRIPWLIKFVANGRLRKDQKDAAARHLRGERAVMKAGY
jgi:ribulose-5-phosphate 4-epimerase/fuculose-1-phosphate aldolase